MTLPLRSALAGAVSMIATAAMAQSLGDAPGSAYVPPGSTSPGAGGLSDPGEPRGGSPAIGLRSLPGWTGRYYPSGTPSYAKPKKPAPAKPQVQASQSASVTPAASQGEAVTAPAGSPGRTPPP
jgi:hypothetical protein